MKENGVIWYWNGSNVMRIAYPLKIRISEIISKLPSWIESIESKYKTKDIDYDFEFGKVVNLILTVKLSNLIDPEALPDEEKSIFFADVKRYHARAFIKFNPLPI